MPQLNPYILLAVQTLQKPTSVSTDLLRIAANTVIDTIDDASTANAAWDFVYAAHYASHYAAASDDAVYYDHGQYGYWLSELRKRSVTYFELSKGNREEYEKKAKYLNALGVNNEWNNWI